MTWMLDLIQQDPAMWDLFTQKEEYISIIRDYHNRFPYYASSNRGIFEPLVSRYLCERGYHVEYPGGHRLRYASRTILTLYTLHPVLK
jgi:hypothetical protein